MNPRVRILDASTVREVVAALPGIGRTALGCVSGSHPSRIFVVTDLDPQEAARAIAVVEESGGSAAMDGVRLVWSATPQARATILDRLRREPALVAFNGAVSNALARWSEPAHDLALPDGRILALSQRVHVMGIVNVTPDSFSDGGRYLDERAAIDHGMRLADEGADILDVGGESTRPGAEPVPDDVESERVLPVVEALSKGTGLPVSIDTMKAAVAKAALDAGAQIVNDVSAGRFDDAMFPLVAERRAPVVLMHMLGEPRTMQKDPRYDDVVGEIMAFLEGRAEAAIGSGVDRERIVVDPGFGFGKTREHNLVLLKRLRELRCLGFPVLAGTSRKSFIGATLGELPVDERLVGTAATVALAVASGASLVRVHDVREMTRAVRMAEGVLSSRETPNRDG
ncbi:MAG: dihydropteroate synthase [Actinomycetota bacterium]